MGDRAFSWRRVAVVIVVVAAVGWTTPALVTSAGADTDPLATLPADATWLETLNAWRAASHLDPVTENTEWSTGALHHSTYIVETGDFGHDEDLGGPFATTDGAAAGVNGNVAASSNATKTDRHFVEQWITAPFHAAGMLDPLLTTTGFGAYRRAGAAPWPAAATLDVLRGRITGPPASAVTFPGDASVLPVLQQSYRGGESPDPLSPCAGYRDGVSPISTGPPLFVLLPDTPSAAVPTATLTRDGVAVESCVYDELTYTNPDPAAEQLGRDVLQGRHQVVVVPRQPLTQGSTYAASVTVTYEGAVTPTVTSWSFTAASQPQVSIGNASIVEGQSERRSVRLTVSLSRPSTEPVTVSYATAPGTASAGSDYATKSGTVTIPAGATSAPVSIAVKGDLLAEGNEMFTVKLTDPQGASLRRATGSVSILTDDRSGSPTTGIRMSIGAASVVEGNAGARLLRFTVSLSASSATGVTAHYAAVAGTATASDFAARSGNVTIPAGSTTAVVGIRVKADIDVEPTELFTVQLSAPVGATIDRATGTGSIINDD